MRSLLFLAFLTLAGCASAPTPFERWLSYLEATYPKRPIVVVVSRDSATVAWERAKYYVQTYSKGPIIAMTDELAASDLGPADDLRSAFTVRRIDRGDSVAFQVSARRRTGDSMFDERDLAQFIRASESMWNNASDRY